MSRRFLTPITLAKGDALPASGVAGDLFYRTDQDLTYFYHSTLGWQAMGFGAPSSSLETLVKNDSGATLPKGAAVYISGADGTNILIKAAQANAESTSSKTFGLLKQGLVANAQGYVVENGQLTGLDTSTATIGDAVWLSPTAAGGLVYGSAKPSAPNHLVYLGVVTRVSATVGEIFVKVQNGYEMNELHDVLIANVTANDVLQWNAAAGVWKNAQVAGTTPSTVSVTAPITNSGTSTAAVLGLDDTAYAKLANAAFTGNVSTTNLLSSNTLVAGYGRGADGNAVIGLVSVGGQTSNQAFIQRDSGYNGVLRISNNGSGTTLFANAQNVAAAVPVTVKGAPSQSANMTEWQNSAGTVLAGLSANGQFFTGTTTPDRIANGGLTTASSGDGTTATLTTTSAHYIAVGDRITVSGVTPTGYNGTFLATAVTANTVSYLSATTGAQTAAGYVYVDSQATIVPRSAGTTGLTIRSAAGQSAVLTRWVNTGGGTGAWVASGGDASFQATYVNWFLSVTNALNTNVATTIKGAANQNADLFRVTNSSSAVLAGLNATGQFFSGTTTTQKTNSQVTISAASASSTTSATFTYSNISVQAFAIGQVITVAGFSVETYFNGTFTVTAVGGTASPWTVTVAGTGFTVGSATNVSGTSISTAAQATIVSVAPAMTTLAVKAATGQNAPIQTWYDNAGGSSTYINQLGQLFAPGIYNTGSVSVNQNYRAQFTTSSASAIPLVVSGTASQSANLQQWHSVGTSVVASIAPTGNLTTVGSVDLSDNTKAYTIASANVLSATTLGTSVVNSSLTKVGLTSAGLVYSNATGSISAASLGTAQALLNSVQTLPSAAATNTLALTSISPYHTILSGSSTTWTVSLPDATTLTVGQTFKISTDANTAAVALVYGYGFPGWPIVDFFQGATYVFTCVSTTANPSSDATIGLTWKYARVDFSGATGTGDIAVLSASPQITSPRFTSTNIATAESYSNTGTYIGSTVSPFMPTGAVMPFAGTYVPAGWVLCDGTAYNGTNASYGTLWTAIGTTYGGTGQSSFNVPDLRGRIPVGQSVPTAALGTFTVTVAAPGVLTVAGSPHNLAAGQQVYLTTTGALPTGLAANTIYYVTTGAATPNGTTLQLSSTFANAMAGTAITTSGTQSGVHSIWVGDFKTLGQNGGEVSHKLSVAEMPAHTHSTTLQQDNWFASGGTTVAIDDDSSGSTGTVAYGSSSAGLSQTHLNMQPYVVLNYIIKL